MKKTNIFRPRSVAVIGASNKPKKLGFQVLKNIIDGGYSGKVYPINIDQKVKKILGLKSYTSISNIKGKVDMAVFLIPAKFVAAALEECGKKRIKLAVIITAGFKEVGSEGLAMENELLKIAKKYGVKILGPNCLGYIDTSINLNASFAPSYPKKGGVAVISQSGAICTAILDWASKSNIGFSKFFSLGNKPDITELDLISYLSKDNETKVIIAYLENIAGNSNGGDFRKIASNTTIKKPIIILKAGTSSKGASAISSHTGSLAGSDQSITALFKQSGVIRASSLEDMFDWAESFGAAKLPGGNRVAIITNAGGPGVMTTDAIEGTHLELATLSQETTEKLKKTLPSSANTHNPIDVIGDADAVRYKNALNIVEKDDGVDSILVLLTPQTSTQITDTAKLVIKKIKNSNKTIIPVFMGGRKINKGIDIFEKNSLAVFEYPERAVKALEKISYCQSCEMGIKKIYKPKKIYINKAKKQKIDNILVKSLHDFSGRQALIAGAEADIIIKNYGLNTVKSVFAATRAKAIAESNKIGYPVVMKIDSPDIVHKSDVGGVIVGIKNETEAGRAYSQIMKNVKKVNPKAVINGVVIYEMISGGMDFFIGAKRDPLYGPMIGFGLGGIYLEVLKDVTFRLAPLSTFDIEKMIEELKSVKIIEGARGKKALNKKWIIDAMIKVSNLMINHPQISEMDINPFKVYEDHTIALDNRFILNQ
ncbi:MAG TPA: acetate--CoA ligase family protein [Patescibacteria group bacterium]|nr:acetate--CoA ligase family protein [Patescibacteria group bacterium]